MTIYDPPHIYVGILILEILMWQNMDPKGQQNIFLKVVKKDPIELRLIFCNLEIGQHI